MEPSRNSTALVLVASPETPEMFRCAASGPEQEVGVEVHRRLEPARGVEPDGNRRRPRAVQVGVHAQRLRHVGVGRHVHVTQWHRLQRLLGHLPQHGGRPQPDLRPRRRCAGRPGRVAFGADHVVQRRGEIGVGETVGHDPVHDLLRSLHLDDRSNPDARLRRRPEVELVRRSGFLLGGDDAADGDRVGWVLRGSFDHVPVRGRRDAGEARRSPGARLRR